MKVKEILRTSDDYCKRFRVENGRGFRLRDYDPADTGDLKDEDKPRAKEALEMAVRTLAEMQERLYAQDRWALLLVFQAMDAAGKDGAIKHVMSGVNPQGCQVHSFKAPSSEELDHDYLWRCACALPERGKIGIFNRSYYEETLVVRVHPELLKKQKLPAERVTKRIWDQRFEEIRHFEQYLANNGIVTVKFFLNVSKKEQKRRLLERLETPDKYWKFCASDVRERECWDDYMKAYEETIRRTATPSAPWYIVPADNKWFTRVVVGAAVIKALASLKLCYPEVGPEALSQIKAAKKALAKK
jgi:PPK2 family polyphosphate:nucleotide phosphotransferase